MCVIDPSDVRVAAWRHVYLANILGAALITVYLVVSSPAARASWWQAAASFSAAAALTAPVSWWVTWRVFEPTRRWLSAARPPTEDEGAAVLRIPDLVAAVTLGFWIATALVLGVGFGTIGANPGSRVATIVVCTLLAGVASSVLSRVLAEHDLRAVFAVVLHTQGPERTSVFGIRRRLVLFWALGSGIPLGGILLSPVAFRTSGGALVSAVTLAAIAVLAGFGFTAVAAGSLAEPLGRIRVALDEVREGRLDVEMAVDDRGEIGRLQAGVNRMVIGLREREQLRDLFGRHVGEEVARAALERGVELGGEVRDVAVLFVDIIASTTMAATRPATEVVGLLNRFFAVVVDVVGSHGGFVNKFEGDAALAVFGAPLPLADAPGNALAAARTLAKRLRDEVPECDAGIGVAAGPAVAGNLGEERRFEYTVIRRSSK